MVELINSELVIQSVMSKYGKRPFKNNAVQRKAWSSVLFRDITTYTFPAGGTSVFYANIAANAAATAVPSPGIIKVKNVKFQAQLWSSDDGGYLRGGLCAIMFIPEGYTLSVDSITQHPEWVMGWKTFRLNDSASSVSFPTQTSVSFSSKLARNLKSGDKVVFIVQMSNASPSITPSLSVSYTASYVLCNN